MAAIHFSKDSLRIDLFSILQSFTCTFCSESLAPSRRNRWLSVLGMVGSQLAERLAPKLGTVLLLARNNHLPRGALLNVDTGAFLDCHIQPGDNAWSESFFANMKKEIIHGNYYQTRDDARQATFEYIERYYNRKRVQKRLGYRCPYDYMMSFLDQQRNELKAVA